MSVKTEEKSYAERQALRYTKNYTNEHICKQIEENCIIIQENLCFIKENRNF